MMLINEDRENIKAIAEQTAQEVYNHCKFYGRFTKRNNIYIPAINFQFHVKMPHNPTKFYYFFRVKILYFYITFRAQVGRRYLDEEGNLFVKINLQKWTKPVSNIHTFQINY